MAWIVPVCALAAACTDDSYRGYELSYEGYEIPLPVKISVGDPYAMAKGTGPVEELENFGGKHIHVWAFNRKEETPFTATRTATDSLTCLTDGERAQLDGTSAFADWMDRPLYYPLGPDCAERFDFFAAYLDCPDEEEALHVEKTASRVRVDLNIDGSQDIMYAKAPLPNLKSTGAQKFYAFSYLSAMEGDSPVFTMNHALVCIDLWVRPGITKDFTNTVEIRSASLLSRTLVQLVVADKEPTDMGAYFVEDSPKSRLLLTEADGSELQPMQITTLLGSPDDDELRAEQDRQTRKLGASFFVTPETLYKLQMDLQPVDPAPGRPERSPVETDVKLVSNNPFLTGHRYQVVMSIFGEYAVLSKITMIDWKDGGSFLIDRDRFIVD